MKFINFKGWKPLTQAQQVEFFADKSKYLATHGHYLNKTELQQAKPVAFKDFKAGYIIHEANELCIDIDSSPQAEKRISSLLKRYEIDYIAQGTRKGWHIWLLIPPHLVPKETKHRIHDCELYFAGVWVFGGKDLEFYYKPFKNRDLSHKLQLHPRADEFFAELTAGAGLLPFQAKEGNDYLLNNPIIADFVAECVDDIFGTTRLFYEKVPEFFGRCFEKEQQALNIFSQIQKPQGFVNRNNILNRICFALCRNVAVQDPRYIYSFLQLVNERVFLEPLEQDEMERSFSLTRISAKNRTLKDYKAKISASIDPTQAQDIAQLKAERDTYTPIDTTIHTTDIFLNIDPNTKKAQYYRTDEVGEDLILSPVRNTADALKNEILRNPTLWSMYYVAKETKGKTPKFELQKPQKRIEINYDLSYKVGIPQLEFNVFRADLRFNMAGTHFNRKINQKQIWTDAEFDKSIMARFARGRIFESENHFALFCHHLKQRMRGKPLSKAFLMLGSEGIGKDTFVQFMAYSLFRKYNNIDYRATAQYQRSFSSFAQDKWAGVAKALIINLNEAGKNYVFGSQSVEDLKAIIGNTTITSEEKGQDAKNYEILALFCFISSNRPAVDLSNTNNDRIYINYCPATNSMRNDPKLIRKWFGSHTIEEIAEIEGGEFVNYIYNTDRFDNAVAALLEADPAFALQSQQMSYDADTNNDTAEIDIENELCKIAELCENPQGLQEYILNAYERVLNNYTSLTNKHFHSFVLSLLRATGYDISELVRETQCNKSVLEKNYYYTARLLPMLLNAVYYFKHARGDYSEKRTTKKHELNAIHNFIGIKFRKYLPANKRLVLGKDAQ